VFLVVQKGFEHTEVRAAVLAFAFQLILQACWTLLFFRLHNIVIALVDIILFWFAILITVYHFKKVSLPATILMLPYLAWVTFAVVLNAAILLLNR
jgi:tryptophan-rich sensory protein